MENKMEFYQPTKDCISCKGSCCKSMPGTASPENISKLFPSASLIESVRLALESGKFSIDWFEGKEDKFYVRASTKDNCRLAEYRNEWNIYHPAWSGECIYLEEDGCKLSFELRLDNCKMVKPDRENKCSVDMEMNIKLCMFLLFMRKFSMKLLLLTKIMCLCVLLFILMYLCCSA